MATRKKFQDLTLADDFLFGETMRHQEVCKPFLEKVLGKKIRRIEYIERQQDLTDTYDAHGIRLDVYLADDKGTVYNVEMQNAKDDLPKRTRFYQSGIDRRTLERGGKYDQLKESYVIFVCNYDHFERGLAVYERVCGIRGCDGVDYDDGSRVFILNSKYKNGNAHASILAFLDCVREGSLAKAAGDTFMETVAKTVKDIKSNTEKERMYMTFTMKLQEVEAKGRIEGIAKSISSMMAKLGLSLDKAMEVLELSPAEQEEVKKIMKGTGRDEA